MQLVNQSLFMKAYRMSGGIAPLINPGIRRGRVVSFEHRPLCASEEALGNHSVEGFIGRRACLDTVSSDWSCRQAQRVVAALTTSSQPHITRSTQRKTRKAHRILVRKPEREVPVGDTRLREWWRCVRARYYGRMELHLHALLTPALLKFLNK